MTASGWSALLLNLETGLLYSFKQSSSMYWSLADPLLLAVDPFPKLLISSYSLP